MISFRLSEEEYDRCRELCFSNGIRSVSEMARVGIHLLMRQPVRAQDEALQTRVSEFEGRLHVLALEIKNLKRKAGLEQVEPPSPPDGPRLVAG